MVSRGRSVEWGKLFEVVIFLGVTPLIFFYATAFISLKTLWFGYFFIITLFLIQGLYSYLNSFAAIRKRRFVCEGESCSIPAGRTSFIVSAYLPNEVDVVEETLLNILEKVERPASGIEVFLAYNTPHMGPIEQRLKDIARKYPELILANAYGSKSKSENLNYALQNTSGEMIVLLDADHLVMKDCIESAWRWLNKGYDAVQGRCKIRNGNSSDIASLIEIEFEIIYGIAHFSKSMIFDSALFGGSNGYWRASVIKSLGFSTKHLTEDIECTLRAILKGHKIVHDRSIVSFELAPENLGSFWHQRKRWSQGWFQVSMEYQFAIFRSKFLNWKQKMLWTSLLYWIVFYDIMTHLLFPIVFAFWLYQGSVSFPMSLYVWISVLVTLTSGPFEAFAAYLNSAYPRPPIAQFIFYSLLTFPFTLFKNTIQVVAIRDELMGEKSWVVSERK